MSHVGVHHQNARLMPSTPAGTSVCFAHWALSLSCLDLPLVFCRCSINACELFGEGAHENAQRLLTHSEQGGLKEGSAWLSEGVSLERQDWVTAQRVWNATLKNLEFICETRDGKYVLHGG